MNDSRRTRLAHYNESVAQLNVQIQKYFSALDDVDNESIPATPELVKRVRSEAFHLRGIRNNVNEAVTDLLNNPLG